MAINIYSKDSVDNLLSAKLSISSLSNAATSTLNATAPTTGQALTYDGTDLVWATVGGGGSYLALAGGAMDSTALVTYSDATYDSEIGGWGFGVELTSDTTQNASIQYNAVSVQNGSGTMTIGPTGLTFPDSTTQTTAAVAGCNFGDAFTLGKVQDVTSSSGYWQITFAPVNAQAMSLGLSVSLSDGTSSESITSYSTSSTWTYTTSTLTNSDYIYVTYNGQRSSIAISNP
jgi:hypothetical protein